MPTHDYGYTTFEQSRDSSEDPSSDEDTIPGISDSESSETETASNATTSDHGSISNGELLQRRILVAEEIPDQPTENQQASASAVAGPISQDDPDEIIRQNQPPADEDMHLVVATSSGTSDNESSSQQAGSSRGRTAQPSASLGQRFHPYGMENRHREREFQSNSGLQVSCSFGSRPQPQENLPYPHGRNPLNNNAGNHQPNPMPLLQELQQQLHLFPHDVYNEGNGNFGPQENGDPEPEIINIFQGYHHGNPLENNPGNHQQNQIPAEQELQFLLLLPPYYFNIEGNGNFDLPENDDPEPEIINIFEGEEHDEFWEDFL